MGYDICPAVNIAAVVADYRRRSLPIGSAVYEKGEEHGLGKHRQEATKYWAVEIFVARAERIGFGSAHNLVIFITQPKTPWAPLLCGLGRSTYVYKQKSNKGNS